MNSFKAGRPGLFEGYQKLPDMPAAQEVNRVCRNGSRGQGQKNGAGRSLPSYDCSMESKKVELKLEVHEGEIAPRGCDGIDEVSQTALA